MLRSEGARPVETWRSRLLPGPNLIMGRYQKNLPVSVSVSVSGPGQGKSEFPDPVDHLASPIGFFTMLSVNGLIQ